VKGCRLRRSLESRRLEVPRQDNHPPRAGLPILAPARAREWIPRPEARARVWSQVDCPNAAYLAQSQASQAEVRLAWKLADPVNAETLADGTSLCEHGFVTKQGSAACRLPIIPRHG
jgi:hypothetical protein